MLVESVLPAARERLAIIGPDAVLADAAKLLCRTQINLVIVCNYHGAMDGVITTSDVVHETAPAAATSTNNHSLPVG